MKKQRKYTEEEIFKIIDKFDGKEFTDYEIWEDMKKELKRKFMTSQGFIKAIKKSKLKKPSKTASELRELISTGEEKLSGCENKLGKKLIKNTNKILEKRLKELEK